jgi:hypothetical protein
VDANRRFGELVDRLSLLAVNLQNTLFPTAALASLIDRINDAKDKAKSGIEVVETYVPSADTSPDAEDSIRENLRSIAIEELSVRAEANDEFIDSLATRPAKSANTSRAPFTYMDAFAYDLADAASNRANELLAEALPPTDINKFGWLGDKERSALSGILAAYDQAFSNEPGKNGDARQTYPEAARRLIDALQEANSDRSSATKKIWAEVQERLAQAKTQALSSLEAVPVDLSESPNELGPAPKAKLGAIAQFAVEATRRELNNRFNEASERLRAATGRDNLRERLKELAAAEFRTTTQKFFDHYLRPFYDHLRLRKIADWETFKSKLDKEGRVRRRDIWEGLLQSEIQREIISGTLAVYLQRDRVAVISRPLGNSSKISAQSV